MKKLLSFPTPPNDKRIVAGYSDEMLNLAISDLSKVNNPGDWEIERLLFLKDERERRKAA